MCVQFEIIRRQMESRGLASVPYGHFWPEGKRLALVLTHDVGSDRGQQFVPEVAALEERRAVAHLLASCPQSISWNMICWLG